VRGYHIFKIDAPVEIFSYLALVVRITLPSTWSRSSSEKTRAFEHNAKTAPVPYRTTGSDLSGRLDAIDVFGIGLISSLVQGPDLRRDECIAGRYSSSS
jgi:hypothetical protein